MSDGFTPRAQPQYGQGASGASGASGATERVPGTHHPVRPTWNPVEEARARAQAAAAAQAAALPQARTGGRGKGPQPVGSAVPAGRVHHTLIPRVLTTVGSLWAVAIAAIVGLLISRKHLTFEDNSAQLDDAGRHLLVGVGAMWFAVYLLGWLWWTVAAGLNARARSIRASSPWRALAGWCLAAVSTIALIKVPGLPVFVTVPLVMLGVIGLALANLGAILGMRTSAAAIGAPTEVWTRLLWLPFLIGMVTSFLGRISAGTSTSVPPAFRIGVGVVQLAGLVFWILTLYRAMSTFDQTCAAPPVQNPVEQLPVFMRHGRPG